VSLRRHLTEVSIPGISSRYSAGQSGARGWTRQDTLLPIVGQKKGWYAEEGLDVNISTTANILRENGIEPAPERNSQVSIFRFWLTIARACRAGLRGSYRYSAV